jgi:uncharacterized protein (DUF58 family)
MGTPSALDPALLSAIDDLELVARLIVEGAMTGPHRSPFHGYSAEFSQYRSYRPGDDLRHLDWKLLARTDRLYTKQFRETTNMATMIVLDASASMAYPASASRGLPARGVSKFRYATMVAAALAHLLITQGDAAGLMTGGEASPVYLPPRASRAHLRAIVAGLDRIVPAGVWRPARSIATAANLLKRRGIVIVISDFYDAEAETLAEMRRAMRRGHEVVMLQVLSREELELPYRGAVEFEDLESGATQVIDAGAATATYATAIAAFLDRWRTDARSAGLDHMLMTTETPPQEALREFLIARANGRQRQAETSDAP